MTIKLNKALFVKYSYLLLTALLISSVCFYIFLKNKNEIMRKGVMDISPYTVRIAYFLGADIDKALYLSASCCFYKEDENKQSYFEICKFLLEKGGNPNKYNENDGSTPFIRICTSDLDFVKLFLKYGANIDIKTKDGNTVLHSASYDSGTEIMAFLIKKGVDVNAKNKKGRTPLICLSKSRYCYYAKIKFLLENGADINLTDNDGHTALDYSIAKSKEPNISKKFRQEAEKIVKLLKENGAIEGKQIDVSGNPVWWKKLINKKKL